MVSVADNELEIILYRFLLTRAGLRNAYDATKHRYRRLIDF